MVINITVIRKRIGNTEGLIQIAVELLKQYSLSIFEYYDINEGVTKYRYQLMNPQKEMVVRWDNAPHYPSMRSFPHHLHHKDKVFESKQFSLQNVLNLLSEYIL